MRESELHKKYMTLVQKAEDQRCFVIEAAKEELDELRRIMGTAEEQYNEQLRKNSETEEARKIELELLQQRVTELEQAEPVIACTDMEITAAEERGRQGVLGEREAALKVLEETLNVRRLPPFSENQR
jgi:hypothetical protein